MLDKAVDKLAEHYIKSGKANFSFEAYKAEGWFDDIGGQRRYLVFEARPLVSGGRVVGAIEVLQDITEHMEARERITFMSRHDDLTGLPNRALLEDRISQAIARATRGGEVFAVAVIGIDRFKVINDALGYQHGDQVLRETAARLLASVRSTDTVSRQGGDEFILMLTAIHEPNDFVNVVGKVVARLGEPCTIDGQRVSLQASVGLSTFPAHGDTAEALIKNANAAMRHAKESGRNNIQVFCKDISGKIIEERTMENRLKTALPDELFIEYQPQLSLVTQMPLGVEALIRWNHPELGLIRPDKFIPLAESGGMIHAIGAWVLQQSCDLIRETGIKVAVNLSPLQLAKDDILAIVEEASRGIEPGLLTLEITESAFINDFETVRGTLEKLKGLGVTIALDDFGTGYSSLTYLRRLPIDYIKIDQSFIRDRQSRPIVQAIIALADSLGMGTIAEGVEAPEHIAFLERHGCTAIQGYYYSRPIGKAKMIEFMRAQSKGPHPVARQRRIRSPEPVLSWSFTFATGVDEMDAQHKKLIQLINKLHVSSANKRNIKKVIGELTDYVRFHFAYEEDLMHKYNAPSTMAHIREHINFVAMVVESTAALDGDVAPIIAKKMAMFLGEWLVNHILVTDKKLGAEIAGQ